MPVNREDLEHVPEHECTTLMRTSTATHTADREAQGRRPYSGRLHGRAAVGPCRSFEARTKMMKIAIKNRSSCQSSTTPSAYPLQGHPALLSSAATGRLDDGDTTQTHRSSVAAAEAGDGSPEGGGRAGGLRNRSCYSQ